jgi:hypothetical protein
MSRAAGKPRLTLRIPATPAGQSNASDQEDRGAVRMTGSGGVRSESQWAVLQDCTHLEIALIILYHPLSSFIILYHPLPSFIILYHPLSSFIILYHPLSCFIIIYHPLSSFIIIYNTL